MHCWQVPAAGKPAGHAVDDTDVVKGETVDPIAEPDGNGELSLTWTLALAELSLTWTLALAETETLGGPCWAVILGSPTLLFVVADAAAGTPASRARASSRNVALRAFAIHPPRALSGNIFQSAQSRE